MNFQFGTKMFVFFNLYIKAPENRIVCMANFHFKGLGSKTPRTSSSYSSKLIRFSWTDFYIFKNCLK